MLEFYVSTSSSILGTIGAKSRREADPWWEIDLDSTHHVESIVFEIMGGLQLNIPVICMLLQKPVGFENPFLAQLESTAAAKEEFIMPEIPELQTYTFTWKLPPKSNGRAVRIQLRQIHTLQLLSIKIYQGDEFVSPTKEDLEITKKSFATTNLEQFKRAKREFEKEMNSGRPKTTSGTTRNVHLSRNQKRELDIIDLNKTMRNRQRATEQYELALVLAARTFSIPELESLWEFVFAPGHPKPATIVTIPTSPEGFDGRGRSVDSPLRGGRTRSKSPVSGDGSPPHPGSFQNSGIKDVSALTSAVPAVGLDDIFARLKHVLYAINMKDKSSAKKLGILCQMPLLVELAEEGEEQLYILKMAIDTVHEAMGPASQKTLNSICKWGQFVYIMHLFSEGRTGQIPYVVFGIERDFRGRRTFSRDDDQWSEGRHNHYDGDQFAFAQTHGISMGGSKHRAKVVVEERNQASNDLGALGIFCINLSFMQTFIMFFF